MSVDLSKFRCIPVTEPFPRTSHVFVHIEYGNVHFIMDANPKNIKMREKRLREDMDKCLEVLKEVALRDKNKFLYESIKVHSGPFGIEYSEIRESLKEFCERM